MRSAARKRFGVRIDDRAAAGFITRSIELVPTLFPYTTLFRSSRAVGDGRAYWATRRGRGADGRLRLGYRDGLIRTTAAHAEVVAVAVVGEVGRANVWSRVTL